MFEIVQSFSYSIRRRTMDVATALLDASRRLSEGEAMKDKSGDHQQRDSWLGSWGGRSR